MIFMPSESCLDWTSLIRVRSDWINKYLLNHGRSSTGKIEASVYSLRFSGMEENALSLIQFMHDSIPEFVFSDEEIAKISRERFPWSPLSESVRYFGDTDPQKDGKCGELLLYLLVEAILKVPMIAHKIKTISDDPQDQVKGSDGVFFGNYKGHDSLLLGESKVHQNKGESINSALKSINEFHDSAFLSEAIQNELFVIKQTRTANMKPEQLDYLLKVLDLHSSEYMATNKVHPILVVYNEARIGPIEDICISQNDGEEKISAEFCTLANDLLSDVIAKIENKWPNAKKVYLDFFFIPVKNVDSLRDLFHNSIHHTSYQRLEKRQIEKIKKAEAKAT